MNFSSVNGKSSHTTIVNPLYTVWVEGLPSTLPSSHRPKLGVSRLAERIGGRFFTDRIFGSTSNTRKIDVELV